MAILGASSRVRPSGLDVVVTLLRVGIDVSWVLLLNMYSNARLVLTLSPGYPGDWPVTRSASSSQAVVSFNPAPPDE
jgi:hypothetical protein